MSRRSQAKRSLLEPDPKYNSRLVSLLVARVLKSGKKSLAERIVYKALDIILEKNKREPSYFIRKSSKKCNTSSRSKIKTCRWLNLSSTN